MQQRNKVLDAIQKVGIELAACDTPAPTELSEAMMSRIGGGVEYIREHDQFSKADTGSGGAFWKSIWRYTQVIQQ